MKRWHSSLVARIARRSSLLSSAGAASYASHLASCCVTLLISACSLTPWSRYEYVEKAEEYLRQKNYDQAITQYQKHIAHRLSLEKRPDWENPYFYYLRIGDVYLEQGDIPQALSSYEAAEAKGIDRILLSDRYRSVARWYEQKDDLPSAITTLQKYRDRDPLLMDVVLDRLVKELTRREAAQVLTDPP